MFCPSSVNLRTTLQVFSTRLIEADTWLPWLNIQQGKKYEEKRFKFTSKNRFKNNRSFISKDLCPNLAHLLKKRQGKLQPPTITSRSPQHLWSLLVLGCSKVFVATMSGKLGPISFHISSGCTLVVCTTQGFNPKATGPMTSGKNKGLINGANQENKPFDLSN